MSRAPTAEREARDAAIARLTQSTASVQRYLSTPRPRTVLVVEDDPSIAKLALVLLDRAEIRAAHAPTIAVARELLLDEGIGVVVVDQNLPDGNGWDFAESLPRSIGVVLMSASVARPDLDLLRARTRADAVVSLLDADGFVATIRRLLA